MDTVTIIKDIGFPIAICLILLYKLIPTVNGLKTEVSNMSKVVIGLKGVVTEDCNNTREVGTNISTLTVEIARLNNNGLKKKKPDE